MEPTPVSEAMPKAEPVVKGRVSRAMKPGIVIVVVVEVERKRATRKTTVTVMRVVGVRRRWEGC